LIVAAGFLARAILSQALFWISYLRLPIGRSLQLGPGFWFFGSDGEFYFHYAQELARNPSTLLRAAESYPSPFFIQVFTVAVGLFGAVPSVGILLNCAAYVGICSLIAHLGLRNGRIAAPAVFALAAVSFSPAGVLWSMQPLKDTFFLFMVMAAVATCFKWHELWTSRRGERSLVLPLTACAATLLALVYALSSMRWYFGLVVWLSCIVLFTGTVFAAPRRAAAVLPNVLLFLLLPYVVILGTGTDMPVSLQPALDWRGGPKSFLSLPDRLATFIKSARDGYDRTPGATNIEAGAALAAAEEAPPKDVPQPAQPVVKAPQKAATIAGEPRRAAGETKPPSVPKKRARRPRKTEEPPPQETIAAAKTTSDATHVASATSDATPAPSLNPPSHAATPPPHVPIAQVTSSSPAPPAKVASADPSEFVCIAPWPWAAHHDKVVPTEVTAKPPAQPAASTSTSPPVLPASIATSTHAPPAPAPPSSTAEETRRETVVAEVKPSESPVAAPKADRKPAKRRPAAPVARAPTPAAPEKAAPQKTPALRPVATVSVPARVSRQAASKPVPASTVDRLITGVAATFLPRTIAQRVGLVRIGGGRGFWLFADFDTIVFDIVLIFTIVYCTRSLRRRRRWPTATFAQIALMFLLIALPVAYTVNNFGTLFRHRQMIYLTLCVLPIALAGEEEEGEHPAEA
jgi:hypothetical protein